MTDHITTMKLNHLSFPSTDVAATAGFFERHLGCTATPFGTSRLLKRPGFDIVIEDASDRSVAWPQNFHLGFELPTLEDVRNVHDRFKADDVEMETEVINHARGSRFFCRAPGGLLVEINTRADAADPYRGSFS
jgi:catechol 2,3-dioxygenase-like lactoylglutathione lyase family enzyme